MKISDRLYHAAREMEARPWSRGQMFSTGDMGVGLLGARDSESVGCCPLGALAIVGDALGDAFEPALLKYCREATGGLPLSTFNDRVARTKYDVISVLWRAGNAAHKDFK